MPSFKGLPKIDDILKDGSSQTTPSTRQLTPPSKDKLVKMEILAVDKVYSPAVTKLLLNPTTVAERKASNWVKHNIPGQSDPLLQWISGSSRVVTFSAMVTKDVVENETIKNVESLDSVTVKVKDGFDIFGGKEINGSGISTIEGALLGALQSVNPAFAGLAARDVSQASRLWLRSITPYLEYYRSLVIPRTSKRTNQSKTPPLIELKMGSLLGNENEMARTRWILESYSITITKMSPELEPIEANVGFTFIEYVDQNKEINAELAAKKLQTPDEINKGAITDNIPLIANNVDSKNLALRTPEGVFS